MTQRFWASWIVTDAFMRIYSWNYAYTSSLRRVLVGGARSNKFTNLKKSHRSCFRDMRSNYFRGARELCATGLDHQMELCAYSILPWTAATNAQNSIYFRGTLVLLPVDSARHLYFDKEGFCYLLSVAYSSCGLRQCSFCWALRVVTFGLLMSFWHPLLTPLPSPIATDLDRYLCMSKFTGATW